MPEFGLLLEPVVVVLDVEGTPKMPEFGRLLVPVVVVPELEGRPLRAPVVPARVRVAAAVVIVVAEEPNFGSLLGELTRGSVLVDAEAEDEDADAVGAAPLFRLLPLLLMRPSRSSRPACDPPPPDLPPPFPATGWRSDRDRLRAAAEEEDDILEVRGFKGQGRNGVCSIICLVLTLSTCPDRGFLPL